VRCAQELQCALDQGGRRTLGSTDASHHATIRELGVLPVLFTGDWEIGVARVGGGLSQNGFVHHSLNH
jgi:hypothetical protein